MTRIGLPLVLVTWMVLVAGCGSAALPAAGGRPATSAQAGARASTHAAVPASGSASPSLTPVKFQTDWIPSPAFLPLYLALNRGYYKQAGIALSITSGRGSAITAQQIGSGQVDMGEVNLPIMALARAKGVPIESFMEVFGKTAFGVIVAKSQHVTTWKGLYGKSLVDASGSVTSFLLPAAFAKLGLNISKVNRRFTSPANLISDYLGGKADAVADNLPDFAPAVQGKRPSNLLWISSVLNVLDEGYAAPTSYIDQHPATIKAFTAATSRALNDLLTHGAVVGEAAKDMIADNPGIHLDKTAIEASWKAYAPLVARYSGEPLGWQSPQAWQETIAVLKAYAGLSSHLKTTAYYTNALLAPSPK